MNIFNDIRQERSELQDRLDDLKENLIEQGREEIDQKGFMPTKVAVLMPGAEDVSFIYPSWENDREEKHVWNEINEFIKAKNAPGVAVALDGIYTPDDDGDEMDALCVFVQIRGWGEMTTIPFDFEDGEAVFEERKVEPITDNGFITALGGN